LENEIVVTSLEFRVDFSEGDASKSELELLRDRSQPEHVRAAAFASMLRRSSGWWGNGPITHHARAVARSCTRSALSSRNIGIDAIDWETVADDALLILFKRATRITHSPRGWLHGVIRNLVAKESEEIGRYIPLEDAGCLFAPTEFVEDPSASAKREERWKFVRAAVDQLPPRLQEFALLHLVEGRTREEVRTCLSITAANARIRHKRAIEHLRKALECARAGTNVNPTHRECRSRPCCVHSTNSTSTT
jgi:DNA-directed RNA polymerase specialized sigma24 family protein